MCRGVFKLVWLEKDAENFLEKTKKKVVSVRLSLFFSLGYCWSSLLGGFATLVSLGYFLKLLTFNFAVAVFFFKNFPIHIGQIQSVTHRKSKDVEKQVQQ